MQFWARYSGEKAILETAPFTLQPNLSLAGDQPEPLFLTSRQHKISPLKQHQRKPLDDTGSPRILSPWPIKQPDMQLRTKFNLWMIYGQGE